MMPCCGLACVAPLWCVSTTEDKGMANMAWTAVKVTTLQGHDFYGPLKPPTGASSSAVAPVTAKGGAKEKSKAKSKSAKGVGKQKAAETEDEDAGEPVVEIAAEGTHTVFAFPVMVNSRPLDKGVELMVFKTKPKAKEKEVQPLKVSSLAKKAKTKE